jgi:NTE family protein
MAKLRLMIFSLALILLSGCASQADIAIPKREPAPLKLTKPPRIALVLGGGGARGYAHLGVIKTLSKAGIPIDLIVGTSAGSIVGALYADNADPQLAERTMRQAKFFDLADFTFVPYGYGFISGRKLQHFLLNKMRSRWFNELKIPLVVVTTDLYSGKPKTISSGPISPAVNASSAMPGAVHPVKMYGHTLIDGGMVAQIPVNIAKQYHPDIIIAVDIEAEFSNDMPTSIAGVFARALDISIHAIADFSGKGADITIHPVVGNVGVFDLSKKSQLIHAGEVAAQKALPQIKTLLAKKAVRGVKKI